MPEEKIFIIPLRDAKNAPRHRRAGRAVKIVREFLARHMKSGDIKIDPALNQKLLNRGKKKPPMKVRVKAVKDDEGLVNASLAE